MTHYAPTALQVPKLTPGAFFDMPALRLTRVQETANGLRVHLRGTNGKRVQRTLRKGAAPMCVIFPRVAGDVYEIYLACASVQTAGGTLFLEGLRIGNCAPAALSGLYGGLDRMRAA